MAMEKLNKSSIVRIRADRKNSNNKYYKIMTNGGIYDYYPDVKLNYFETRKYELFFTVPICEIYITINEWNSANQYDRMMISLYDRK